MYKGYCILHDPMGTTLATNTASEGLPSCGIEVYIRECGGAAICFRQLKLVQSSAWQLVAARAAISTDGNKRVKTNRLDRPRKYREADC